MKKFIIPLLTAAVVVSMILTGCVPAAPPEVTPPPVTPPPVTPPPVTPPPAPGPGPIDTTKVYTTAELQALAESLQPNPYQGLAVKPDGTPYKFASTVNFTGCDNMINSYKQQESLIERAGAEVIQFDPGGDVDKQIAFLEDVITVHKPDALLLMAVEEAPLVPSVEKAVNAGIPVFLYDFHVPGGLETTFVGRNPAGKMGSNAVGAYIAARAEAENKEVHVYELWGQRSVMSSQDRHTGFHAGIAGCPLVTVTESPDTMWGADLSTSFVTDAFNADPTLNSVFSHGGDEILGAIEALRAMGRLYPVDDPKHVIILNNDTDGSTNKAMDEMLADVMGTHHAQDMAQGVVQCALINIVLGKPIPKLVILPQFVLTQPDDPLGENYKTFKVYGALADWCLYPQGEWDKWRVLDFSELGQWDLSDVGEGIYIPTAQERYQLLGY